MALNIKREDYDKLYEDIAGGIPRLPTFSDRFGPEGPAWDPWLKYRKDAPVDDMRFEDADRVDLDGNSYRLTRIWPREGHRYSILKELAQLGFKPGNNFLRKGWPILPVTLSRVSDLEGVTEYRNVTFAQTPDPRIQSHVKPYVLASFTPATTTADLGALGLVPAGGAMLPFPWPRVLQWFRIWDVTNNKRHWPRGAIIRSDSKSGPAAWPIDVEGTMIFHRQADPILTPQNNVINVAAGVTYEIQIGHIEEGTPGPARQRWYSDVHGDQPWVPGDPLTA